MPEEIYLKKKKNYVLLLAGTNKIPCFHRQQARHMINLLLIWNCRSLLFNRIAFVHVSLDPIDAMRSSVQDVVTNTTQKGAFTFRVALKDRFNNSIRITDNKKHAKISVQYSSYTQPQSMTFLQCSTTPTTTGDGDAFVLNCAGAEKERILFYPSINNVPLGGQEKYEARTTLCPGRSSCDIQGTL